MPAMSEKRVLPQYLIVLRRRTHTTGWLDDAYWVRVRICHRGVLSECGSLSHAMG